MKLINKSIIAAALLLSCVVVQAATDTATYKITSDGSKKFQYEFSVSNPSTHHAHSQQSTTDYVAGCSDVSVIQGGVTTGTAISLYRPDSIKVEDENLVNFTLTQSELRSLRSVETEKCVVQLPDVRSFTVSANIALPVGAKHQINKGLETGEKWFVERIK